MGERMCVGLCYTIRLGVGVQVSLRGTRIKAAEERQENHLCNKFPWGGDTALDG